MIFLYQVGDMQLDITMKKGFLLIAIVILTLAGCGKDVRDHSENVLVYVDAELILSDSDAFVYWNKEDTGNVGSFKMKEGENGEWKTVPVTTIQGFTFQEGYVWKLDVTKTYLSNPPQDGSSITYSLVKVIDKKAATLN